MTRHAKGFAADHKYVARMEFMINSQLKRNYRSKRYGKVKYASRFLSSRVLFAHQLCRGDKPWPGRIEEMTLTDAHFKNCDLEDAYWKRLKEQGEGNCGGLWRWRPVDSNAVSHVSRYFCTYWMEHEQVSKEEFVKSCERFLTEKMGVKLKQRETKECPTTQDS